MPKMVEMAQLPRVVVDKVREAQLPGDKVLAGGAAVSSR